MSFHLQRQVDNLAVNYIDIIPEDHIELGGVKDMGEYPTGSCVEIRAKVESIKGRKVVVSFNVYSDKNVTAEGEVIAIRVFNSDEGGGAFQG